jgi:mono/diheme cytochrome c family protein
LDDYIRPWKAVQIEAIQIQRRHTEEAIKNAQKEIDSAKLKEMNQKMADGQKIVDQRVKEISKAEKELDTIKAKLTKQNIDNGVFNADSTEVNFKYESSLAHGDKKSAEKYLKKLQKLKNDFDLGKDNLKALQASEKLAISKIEELKKEVLSAEKENKEITGKLELLEMAKKQAAFDPIFALRNMPFLDFLDPTIKIQQIVIDNVTDDRYFRQVPKVDRCITCHTFIDKTGFEKEKNPFKTHPKLDLMVGIESPHPMKKTGCTSCHGGEGHRVNDFNSVAHMPNDEKQEKEWVKKYSWHEPHKVPQPMFKRSQTEAGCVKCHSGVDLIPKATVLNEGRMGIEKFGCYACHKIEGWEHRRKPGPSLEKISSKVDKEWFKSWVWSPKSFNKHAKMPSFFMQSNNSKAEFAKMNVAEVNAIAEYVYSKSKNYAPNEKFRAGNAANGKALIAEVGCLGCHGVEGLEDQSKKIGAYAGPYLTGTGSKVSGDWLVSWLKKPWHYQEDTIMPSMRLTDSETMDIATYLLSLKNEKFEKIRLAPLDKTVRDTLLVDYYSAFDTLVSAKSKVAAIAEEEKTLELGKRSVGKYGCYSCHKIEGFDGYPPIGPELTKEGSKPITQFGYGIQHQVPHQRDAWITAHLQNPRMWDIGIDKNFRDLNRMPNFYMSKEEAEKITIALLGQVADSVPLLGQKRLNASEALYHDAMKVAGRYNCVGCHQIDGLRGDILKAYEEDVNQGPPVLVNQGHRVQADWFFHFLSNVQPIRPWVKVRMPSFNLSLEEKNRLINGFQNGAKQGFYEDPQALVTWQPGEKEEAKKLFDALACTSCHTIGFNSNPALAPDLHKASKRLRPSWIKKWLSNPQGIMPNTTMPQFWGEDGMTAADPTYFDGDAKKQIDAITKLVIEFGGTR